LTPTATKKLADRQPFRWDSFTGNLTASQPDTGDKNKKEKPPLRIFENFFSSRTLGTFAFAPNRINQPQGQSQKSQIILPLKKL